MSDDVQDLESGTEDAVSGEQPEVSFEDLRSELAKAQAELTKVRKEAAARRVAKRDAEQTAEERITELRREIQEMRMEKVRTKVAKEAGLDLDLADRIRGESEDEMLEDAKLLAKKYRSKSSVEAYGGRKGPPVGSEITQEPNHAFNKWFRENS